MTGEGKTLVRRSFSVLPACVSKLDTVCIESLDSRKLGESKWERGTLSKTQFDESEIVGHVQPAGSAGAWKYSHFKIDEEGIPYGGIAPIWEMTRNVFSEGKKYVTSFTVDVDNTNMNSPQISIFTSIYGIVSTNNFVDAWNGNGPTIYQMPTDIEFKLTVRLGKLNKIVNPWLKGHMQQAKVSQDLSTITISGTSTKVTLLTSDYLNCDQLPKVDEAGSPLECGLWKFSNRIYDSFDLAFQKDQRYPDGAFPTWESKLKPIGDINLWFLRTPLKFSSKKYWENFNSGKCSQIVGTSVISTNSTLDSDLPPKWNPVEKSLEFDVAGPHFDTKGKENLGFYSLSMPKELAKCFWGFDLPDNQLEVSITSGESSNSQVAISSISSNASNFNFNVSGFKYSAHTIVIRPITGKGSVIKYIDNPDEKIEFYEMESIVENVFAKSTASAVKKIIVLKCSKGKLIKKVSGTNPKCPAGYKVSK
jgi:hypothetical protein